MIQWILAGAAIAGGYTVLWFGGTTSAALLLVAGYCALMPWAIMQWRHAGARRPSKGAPANGRARQHGVVGALDAPPWLAAAIAAAAVLALYVATLAPSTAMWDTSEYIAVAKTLGVPHPPGNPTFVLIAHLFGALPLPVSYAVRMNLLAAVSSATASGLWFLVTYVALETMIPSRRARLAASFATVLLGATAFTVWNQSVVNEKVYTVSLAQMALVCWLAVLWMRRAEPADARSDRLLLLGAYLIALGYTVHPAGLLAAAPFGTAVLAVRARTLLRPRLIATAALLFFTGLTPFAYEPIRSAHDPAINEGEPTACAGHIAVSCTLSAETLERLRANIDRDQYGKPSVLVRQAPFTAQLGMWWLYWKWQWFRDAHGAAPPIQLLFAFGALALAAAGGVAQWRHDRRGFWMMASLIATLTVALIYYLNFRYGWSQSPELTEGIDREVRDRDYFFIWSFSALSVWMGIGLAALWKSLVAAGRGADGWLRAAPVLAIAFIPLVANWHDASRAGQLFTRDWAHDALESAEPGAVLFTAGDNDTFPLWYAQEVEGIRRDVTVIIAQHLGLDWPAWQVARRLPAVYDREAGPAVWRDAHVPAARSALQATRAELDAVPVYLHFDRPQLFVQGQLRATLDSGFVSRDQLLLLRVIRDSFPERPVMFTHPSAANSVGLGQYLVRVGLLWALTPEPAAQVAGNLTTTGGVTDVARSLRLWHEVYRGPAQLAREGDWVDEASLSIPATYVYAGSVLADALRRTGTAADAAAVQQAVDSMVKAARLERVFAPKVAGGE